MSDGLKAQHRAAIIATLAANDRVERAVLFGSRAMGTNTITSDVDIALFGDRLTLTDQAHLAATCDDLPMAQSVDLVLHNTIDNPALVDHIRTHGVEWYRRDEGEDSIVSGRLGDIAEIVMGQSPPGKSCNEWGKGIPLLNGPTEFGSYHPTPVQFTTDARKVAMTGDILFCVRGSTTGRMNYADQQYAIGRGIAAIRHKTNSQLQPLIRGIIETQLSSLLQAATGSTFPNVSANQLSNLIIPKITERQMLNIADLLKSFDDKIELNRRMNETLEAMARAIFKDWFVDFGPVRAKVEGREAYLPEEVWGLFPDSFQESELGEIPRGWGVKSISDLANIKGGRQLQKDNFLENGTIPVFGGAGIMGYTDQHNADGFVIAVGRVGAYCGQFFSYRGKTWINNNASLILPKVNVFGEWLLFTLKNLDIDLIKKGAAQPFISSSDIAAMQVVIPEQETLAEFHNTIESLVRKKENNEHQIKILIQVRDSLLPRLISGEIRVGEIEKVVEVMV